jgi:gliding motility-associated-like protein
MVYYLKAITPGGCISYDTLKIAVYKGPDIYLPTAFSPNNDGVNDVFNPFPVGMKKISSFKVFNRYGQLIYSTVNSTKGWDGKFNGKVQPAGTYVWIASGIDYIDKKVIKKGTVLIIR